MTTWRMAMRFGYSGYNLWPQCRKKGVAAIAYEEFKDIDLNKFKQDDSRIPWKRLEPAQRGFLRRVAYDMKAGDIIYVKDGKEIVGRGTVTGPYRFDPHCKIIAPDDPNLPFAHQVPVKWEDDFPRIPIILGSEPSTVLALKDERLRKLEKAVKRAVANRRTSGPDITVAKYKQAFLAIEDKINPKQREILRANYAAPNNTISVNALGQAVGHKQPWLEYGRLAHLMCKELNFQPTLFDDGRPVYTQVLADEPAVRTQESWEWKLRPEVVQALEELGWIDSSTNVNTYILTWNPTTEFAWEDVDWFIKQTTLGNQTESEWSTGHRKAINIGDRLFLFRQGDHRGLIGSGHAISNVRSNKRGRWQNLVQIRFDHVLSAEQVLPVGVLKSEGFGLNWDSLRTAGIQIPPESTKKLEELWTRHLIRIGRTPRIQLSETSASDTLFDNNDGLAFQPPERVLRRILQRQGQPLFRGRLIAAYSGKCAVTGCDAKAALEAAHIDPYCDSSSNRVSNGILLRSDIHTLFDLGLICINPKKMTVDIAPEMDNTSYAELKGHHVRLPIASNLCPDSTLLARRWKEFKEYQR